jgi:hypothetical protein
MTSWDVSARWQLELPHVFWRYDVTARLTDEAGTDFGSIEVGVMLTGRVSQPPSVECVTQFGGHDGMPIAYPFLREAIASTALRLGFTGILLPLQKREDGD